MKVNSLDHVNVVAIDLEHSARFYEELFGLERRDAPAPLTPRTAQWLADATGRVVVHLNSPDCPRSHDRQGFAGPTGAIHHIALNCTGFAEAVARLEARGLAHEITTIQSIGLRQIFVSDPNGVLIELNFFGE